MMISSAVRALAVQSLFISHLYSQNFTAPLPDFRPVPFVEKTAASKQPEAAPAFFLPELWDALKPPNKKALAEIAARLPGIDISNIREITAEPAKLMMARAVEVEATTLDFFTDSGLQTDRLFYISQAVIAEIDKEYDIRSLYPLYGTALQGTPTGESSRKENIPFAMMYFVAGAGKVHMLYNLKEFVYNHPVYTSLGGQYIFQSHVWFEIAGPGHSIVNGVELVHWPSSLAIKELIRIPGNQIKVVTWIKDDIAPSSPIIRR